MQKMTNERVHDTGQKPRRRQQGAVAVLVALAVIPLVLMLGLVLDIGHLYVAKNELQNAADACALSGARELNDLSAGALDRATAAARTAGNRNRVDLQRDAVDIQDAEVTFSEARDGPFARAITPETRYVRCAPHESNLRSIVLWFMAITGVTDWGLSAEAVARLVGGQSMCAIPVAMCTTATPGTPNLGFVTGTWYSGRLAAGTTLTGNYEWVRFEGQQGARDLGEILAGTGMCNLGQNRVDAEPGVTTGVAQAWNTRFGLYSGQYNDIDLYPPDRTGYAYTRYAYNDKKGKTIDGSWTDPPHAPPQNAYADYPPRKNGTHDPYNPMALQNKNGTPVKLPGNPAPLAQSLHASKGQDRRTVFVPVIACQDWAPNKKNMVVLDYACAFMTSPVDDPGNDVQLEYRGLKSQGACGTTGFPGDSGPPVPALVK